MKKQIQIWVAIFLGFSLFPSTVIAQEINEIISQERAKQIARQISGNIARRISIEVSDTTKATLQQNVSLDSQNPMAASSDINSMLPDSTWLSSSWSEISEDDALGDINIDADIYQITGGVDKQLGDWFIGLSTTYAYTETEISGFSTQSDTHTVTVTPYVAFVITDNFFISGFTSYSYSRSEPDTSGFGGNLDSDTDEYTSELDLNGLKVIGDWTLTGKSGFRYSHTDITFDNASIPNADNDNDNWTYFVDAQVGYSLDSFVKGLRISAGALYEYVETEDGEDDGVLYMSTGIDYAVNKSFTVGLRYSHDANNEDIDINTVGFNLRLAL